MPGASPTINSRALGSPNESTGALCQSGSRARVCSRKSTSRGQSGQLRPGSAEGRASALVVEIVVCSPWRHGGRALQELRRMMARLARGGALGGGAGAVGLAVGPVGEDVGLAPQ